jgi:hypothetical protein
MRIKIIGENNCARATRHLLRLAGFAVTEFLPADAVVGGPLSGYAITIDLAPALHTPDTHLRPDPPTLHPHSSASEEAPRSHRDASSPSSARTSEGRTSASEPVAAPAKFRSECAIHFDSVDSALEAAVLRHVTQLAAAPVIVDRPGGVVHSDRELRIVAPNTGDAQVDEAAAVAIEFGVLRGLLDLTAPAQLRQSDSRNFVGKHGEVPASSPGEGRKKKWWPFGILLLAGICGAGVSPAGSGGRVVLGADERSSVKPLPVRDALLLAAPFGWVSEGHRLKSVLLGGEPQGQFATGQGFRITDGNNFLVVDPCKAQIKFYASISQTGNTQVVAGTASKKIYVCSIHVVTAAAANVAVVEGTGSVCGTGTAGVSGFGGATAATGWNFVANGGIALGNGDSSLGAEGTSGDNLCVFNSGSGQVSGGISYVVE